MPDVSCLGLKNPRKWAGSQKFPEAFGTTLSEILHPPLQRKLRRLICIVLISRPGRSEGTGGCGHGYARTAVTLRSVFRSEPLENSY